jgi:hypothetical protein
MGDGFFSAGWQAFPHDIRLENWIADALPAARQAVNHRDNAQWLRCGGAWFAGVNALPNDGRGAVGGGSPLGGRCLDFIQTRLTLGRFEWDRGQVSVCYPGYPKPMDGESAAAYRYRLTKDAAHVDGLLAEGIGRRRFIREHHAFILGIPLVQVSSGASPFVIWEGSHRIMQAALQTATHAQPPGTWRDVDVTNIYQAARKNVFTTCRRVEIVAEPGESYIVHRHALHGMAPWQDTARCGPDGRMIIYFRPETVDLPAWLNDP